MIKNFVNTMLGTYGSVENEKALRIEYSSIVLIFLAASTIFSFSLPHFWIIYFRYISALFAANAVAIYFFKKKKNADKHKKLKIICCFSFLFIFFIMISPAIIAFLCIDYFADLTNKIFVLKKYPMCFLVETVYYTCFVITLSQQTYLNAQKPVLLTVTYIIFITFNKILCSSFRIIFIRGKNKYYNRYRYAQEMDVISEYLFLGVSTISILYSETNYSFVFIPVLLYYSLKQTKKYRKEKKNSHPINLFLLETMQQLQIINDIYLETSLHEELIMSEYIKDAKTIKYYIAFHEKRKFYHFLFQKRIQTALQAVQELLSKRYALPDCAQQAREDLEAAMNSIMKCIR